jgi:DNA invertase Pin-like site-specific DNA recombinase
VSGSRQIRCAIYTRKSTEEGLEQEFNSLDAQREACAAYIASQRNEGWIQLSDFYDDGGYSGGTMERPGLKALLAQVAAGKVDVIVVYKVDRLTRALSDFAKIVEVLDARGASFVSVTQSFNTTTSMGRLTLNVLLSFAQFEREVTGERIRDKVAASKKKGMWMGGPVPLGYDVRDRKLVVNEAEAAKVRLIFERYVTLGSLGELAAELDREGVRSKCRILADGTAYGDRPFSKGAIAHLLKNRVYIGEVTHKGERYPGEQAPLIARALWDEVEAVLQGKRRDDHHATRVEHPSPLAGRIVDGEDRPMTPRHTTKGTRRYRYYVTAPDTPDGRTPTSGWRLPAGEIEQLVQSRLAAWLGSPSEIVTAMSDVVEQTRFQPPIAAAGELAAQVTDATPSDLRNLLLEVDANVAVRENGLTISLCPDHLAAKLLGAAEVTHSYGARISITVVAKLVRKGQELRLAYQPQDRGAPVNPDVKLIGQIAKAEAAHRELVSDVAILPARRPHLLRLARLKFLAPDIVTAILDGRQPATLSARQLLRESTMPLCWQEQRQLLGFRAYP